MSGQLRNRSATAALVLGVLGVLLFLYASNNRWLTRDLPTDAFEHPLGSIGTLLLAVLAICFGCAGLSMAAKVAMGRAKSITGIVLGGLVILLVVPPDVLPAPVGR
jgi:hypothetical protein